MKKPSRHQQMKRAALDAAMHAYAVQRALATTPDEALQQALIRWGPVPATCQVCQVNPPRVIQIGAGGRWVCNVCAHGEA